ncbi:MAG: Gfo/Idh/MocA family oxidoreductase [Mycoplasmatales bacterium]
MNGKSICIVGLGKMGLLHFKMLLKRDDIKFPVNVFETNEKRKNIEKKFGGKIKFIEEEDLVEAEYIIITAPTFLHKYFLKKFKNKKILIEKPLISLTQSMHIKDVFHQNKIMVGYSELFRTSNYFFLELVKFHVPKEVIIKRTSVSRTNFTNVIEDLAVHDLVLLYKEHMLGDFIIEKKIIRKNTATINFRTADSVYKLKYSNEIQSGKYMLFKKNKQKYISTFNKIYIIDENDIVFKINFNENPLLREHDCFFKQKNNSTYNEEEKIFKILKEIHE